MTPLETVNEFMYRITKVSADATCELVSDDVEYDNVPMGKVFGHEGIGGAFTSMANTFDEVDFIVHREAATGNIVMNERTDRFVSGARTWDLLVMGVFELNDDGKITLWRDYFDLGPVNEMFAAVRS